MGVWACSLRGGGRGRAKGRLLFQHSVSVSACPLHTLTPPFLFLLCVSSVLSHISIPHPFLHRDRVLPVMSLPVSPHSPLPYIDDGDQREEGDAADPEANQDQSPEAPLPSEDVSIHLYYFKIQVQYNVYWQVIVS